MQELENSPKSLRSGVWEHFGFLISYDANSFGPNTIVFKTQAAKYVYTKLALIMQTYG